MFARNAALLVGLCCLGGAIACSPQGGTMAADYVFTNGKVYTVSSDQAWAEAVAVADNEIVYVGDAAGAEAFVGDATERIDLDGKMVLPGFVSGHDHLIASNWLSYGVQLYDAKTKEEYHQLIRDYVEANPDEKVIRGIGWNPALYGSQPTFAELDAIVSDRPAILMDFTIHDAWLNSEAMKIGGITKDTEDPLPGVTYWTRDADGNPTGTGIEFAWMPTYVAAGAWEPEKMIPASQQKNFAAAVRSGLTTFLNPAVVTPNVNNPEGMWEDYEVTMQLLTDLDARGELTLRAFVQPGYKSPDADPVEFADKAAAFAERYASDRVRSFGVKIHPEGNWSSRTSLQLEPYSDSPGNSGAAGVTAPLMKEVVLASNAKGLDVITHVDGSATVRAMIDAIEAAREAGYTDERNALHHLFWTHPDDLQRIFDMNIPVNVTPNFSTDWTGQDIQARALLGEERIYTQLSMYPRVAANGNELSLSADIPSSPLALIGPLFNIEVAITLQDATNPDSQPFPEGRDPLTLEQAIDAVTIGPAWQIRMEDKIGSLEVGKYADLVVLEQNLFDVAPRDIADVRVLATMMDGKFTHRDGL